MLTTNSFAPDLSLEFLMGRALDNAMLNVGLKDVARGLLLRGNMLGLTLTYNSGSR